MISQLLDYYPFGDTRIDEGMDNETKQYTGYIKDEETGLHYAGARYYAGNVGRFISQDPVALLNPAKNLSDPQKFNLYSYAKNNPIIYVDPEGKEAVLVHDYKRNMSRIDSRFYGSNGSVVTIPSYLKGGFDLDTGKFGGNIYNFMDSAGINIQSSGGCSNQGGSSCTSLDGIRKDSILGTINLKQSSGDENMTITGGTEIGHFGDNRPGIETHYNGWKVDFRPNAGFDSYIRDNFDIVGKGGHGPLHSDGSNIYYDETGNTSGGAHWDVKFKETFSYTNPKKSSTESDGWGQSRSKSN